VPEDVSIIGFDNLEFASHLEPPLTTIDVPAKEMGESAADFLVRRVTGQSVARAIHLEPRLIVRQTSGPAPTA
jgi:LacI family transcriptional regulator